MPTWHQSVTLEMGHGSNFSCSDAAWNWSWNHQNHQNLQLWNLSGTWNWDQIHSDFNIPSSRLHGLHLFSGGQVSLPGDEPWSDVFPADSNNFVPWLKKTSWGKKTWPCHVFSSSTEKILPILNFRIILITIEAHTCWDPKTREKGCCHLAWDACPTKKRQPGMPKDWRLPTKKSLGNWSCKRQRYSAIGNWSCGQSRRQLKTGHWSRKHSREWTLIMHTDKGL